MDIRIFLSKIIMLIYRTGQLNMDSYNGMIESSLTSLKLDNTNEELFMGVNKTKKLVEYIVELLHSTEKINLDTLIPTLAVMLDNDPKLFKIIQRSLSKELDENEIKQMVASLVSEISSWIREQKAIQLVSQMSYDMKFNRAGIPNFADYLKNALVELEPLTLKTATSKDPAIVSDVDINDLQSVIDVFREVRLLNEDSGMYKTGWRALNKMMQGGMRPGEFITIGALQHKYKTGFTRSLFIQTAIHNAPIMTEEEKEKGLKPLLLYLSFEDNGASFFQFAYQYLKASEGIYVTKKDLETLSPDEMAGYVKGHLETTGFYARALRIDPSMWTFSAMFNFILQWEAQGFKICMVVIDYLLMLPTTGCTQGPAGTDKRDLIRRTRNFMSARGITCVTPAQLSTEAKQLIRNGVGDVRFVKEIAEKGYYADCRQLDQEIDMELYVHLASENGKKYLTVGRGKHRVPTTLSDDDKFFILPFPELNVPVLPDLDKADTSMKSLPRYGGGDFGGENLLDEVLG